MDGKNTAAAIANEMNKTAGAVKNNERKESGGNISRTSKIVPSRYNQAPVFRAPALNKTEKGKQRIVAPTRLHGPVAAAKTMKARTTGSGDDMLNDTTVSIPLVSTPNKKRSAIDENEMPEEGPYAMSEVDLFVDVSSIDVGKVVKDNEAEGDRTLKQPSEEDKSLILMGNYLKVLQLQMSAEEYYQTEEARIKEEFLKAHVVNMHLLEEKVLLDSVLAKARHLRNLLDQLKKIKPSVDSMSEFDDLIAKYELTAEAIDKSRDMIELSANKGLGAGAQCAWDAKTLEAGVEMLNSMMHSSGSQNGIDALNEMVANDLKVNSIISAQTMRKTRLDTMLDVASRKTVDQLALSSFLDESSTSLTN